MATQVTWGILGPGTIAANFAQGLAESDSGTLVAIASRDADRRRTFGDRFGVADALRFDSYSDLLSADVDAIYVATPHPFHAQQALDVIRAGKHLLVEKPAGLVAGEAVVLAEAAAQAGVMFAEGLMYRAHPQIALVCDLIRKGEIGQVKHIKASFGFAANFDPTSRLFDPAMGGGAILDVGVYPVSFARLIAGVATGQPFAEPDVVAGTGTLAPSGVDASAHAILRFDDAIIAEVATAIDRNMDNSATITGSDGEIHLPDPWVPGRDSGPSDATVVVNGSSRRTIAVTDPRMLFAHEAQAISRAIHDGATIAPHPLASPADTIGTMRVLDRWRQQVGYKLPGETAGGLRRLTGVMPKGLPEVPTAQIDGADRPISTLILGCDNRDTLAEGALVWDAWWDAGGRAFDTGFVYGGGLHEDLLGQWMQARGVGREADVIVKGAHSPYCVPDAITVQLDISLERLQLDRAPIYILHRDNPDVPVGEFVDALNRLADSGRIGAFGGSNWTPARIDAVNDYAARHGLRPFTMLNNNLSLAVMERPIWPGCLSSNTPQTLAWLKAKSFAHISWSSQARGFFLNAGEGAALPEGTEGNLCYASDRNAERRRRAVKLAQERGVAPHQIATAWVLQQPFPSFAVIGPRSPGEIASTLEALRVGLSQQDIAWLNCETDQR